MEREPIGDVAINGYGRIGILSTRLAIDDETLNVAAINAGSERSMSLVADELHFDSIHRRFEGHDVRGDDNTNTITIDGQAHIPVFAERDVGKINWRNFSNDLTVIESTGTIRTHEDAIKHIDSGAKRVVITAPSNSPEVRTIVRGVTDKLTEQDARREVFAVSSCSTNCIAPILRILNELYDIRHASAVIPHAATNSQRLLDAGGIRSGLNVAAATTGSDNEIRRLFPDLQTFHATSVRVPESAGSVAILSIFINGHETTDSVVEAMEDKINEHGIQDIIRLSRKDMFSKRVVGLPFSSVIDLSRLRVTRLGNQTELQILAWFDNEWGYSNRVVEVAKMIINLTDND